MKRRILGFIAVIMFIIGASMIDCPPGTDAKTEALNIAVATFFVAGSFIIGGYASAGKEET